MRHLKKHKKGFIMDVMTIAIYLFITGIVILCSYLALSSINTGFQASDDIAPLGKTVMQDRTDNYIATWDGIFGFFFVGLSIAAFIGAFMLDTNPVFFVLAIILLIIFIVAAAAISNAYYEVESTSSFSDFAEDFRVMHWILNHLPYYVVVEGFIIVLALYAKANYI